MGDARSQTVPSYTPSVPPRRGVALSVAFVVAAIATLTIAFAWSYVARSLVSSAIKTENEAHVDRARTVFEMMRGRMNDGLRVQSRVLAEDPRLKATLATEGIDEATVADILTDLGGLRRGGFLIILSSEGRVFAQAGAEELRGLDLSSSSVVQKARGSKEAVVGSWVIGRAMLDLSAMPIRSDGALVAYLVVGQAVDREMITAVADSTGVGVALGIGSKIAFASSDDSKLQAAFAAIMQDARQPRGQVIAEGETFVTGFVELEQSTTRPYLILARPLEPTTSNFALINWMLWAPPAFVFLALLLSRIRSKQLARMPRSGGV